MVSETEEKVIVITDNVYADLEVLNTCIRDFLLSW